ncbi:MAG: sugar MFS transporter [Opitutales bacterium]
MESSAHNQRIFWGCFIALITTSMAFIIRAILIGDSSAWPAEFGLDRVQAGTLFGAGLWPFSISIIVFSLFIDKVGYRFAMFFSFGCYLLFGVLMLMAYGAVNAEGVALEAAQANAWGYLLWGSVILGLGNGTVEAFINPVVATLFRDEKSKWLNILHAGWPGGLVLGGVLTILLGGYVTGDWRVLIGLIFLPAVVYLVMLFNVKFPVQERVAAGTSYREMLAEFGIIGALIAFGLIFARLTDVGGWPEWLGWMLTILAVGGYGAYCRSLGRPLLIALVLIMIPLAITELGTDGWITGLMERPMSEIGWNPAWVLVYTSAIMMVLRFFAGPVIKALTPIGLLAAASALAILGLWLLSFASGLFFIFFAATVYGVAKSYFWPTMLGTVAEQSPKGGALTINAIAGIGMLCVGIIGTPFIGYIQESSVAEGVKEETTFYETIMVEEEYLLGVYDTVDSGAAGELTPEQQDQLTDITDRETQGALAKMTIFPAIMLAAYIALWLYFRSKGGYRAASVESGH